MLENMDLIVPPEEPDDIEDQIDEENNQEMPDAFNYPHPSVLMGQVVELKRKIAVQEAQLLSKEDEIQKRVPKEELAAKDDLIKRLEATIDKMTAQIDKKDDRLI